VTGRGFLVRIFHMKFHTKHANVDIFTFWNGSILLTSTFTESPLRRAFCLKMAWNQGFNSIYFETGCNNERQEYQKFSHKFHTKFHTNKAMVI
jgi:hypothetical protein